jgi:ABC-type transport system involved in multi-copper enzyme maturation permease subunit
VKKADANFLPVVQRELREGARRPFNYWLRVGGAMAGVWLLFVISKRDEYHEQAAAGLHLFTSLHQMMLALICLIVPAISAECISREKREGTLGLLFLTPLTALGVVVGKGLVQTFRAFTLWLAVLPVLIIPCLSGGVTGTDVMSAITIEFCVTLLCLSAGIMASSLAKARNTAFLLAAILTVSFLTAFGGLLGAAFALQTQGFPPPIQEVYNSIMSGGNMITGQSAGTAVIIPPSSPPVALRTFVQSVTRTGPNGIQYSVVQGVTTIGPNGTTFTWVKSSPLTLPTRPTIAPSSAGWASYGSTPANRLAWRSLLLESLFTVPLLFYLVLRLAAHRMANSWQEKGPSLRRESWIKTYCVPLARERFKRKLQRLLDWNPIAWLQLYSWKGASSDGDFVCSSSCSKPQCACAVRRKSCAFNPSLCWSWPPFIPSSASTLS